jgi:hypothetical protein
LLAEQARKTGVEVWAYCLMPNQGVFRGRVFRGQTN